MPAPDKSARAEAVYILKTPAGQLIARDAFYEGTEAAAEWLEKQEGYGSRNRLEYAHNIRKLKKP